MLYIGKKNYNYEYKINNVNISSSKVIRDLGVEIDDCLKFDVHISYLVKKAYQRLAVLFKGFSSRDSAILTMAYKVYIRPILEYCSEVWSPYLLKHIDEIENVQRYFTRKIRGLSSFNYENRLFILGLESLEMRRIKRDLKMCFKIFYGIVDLDINSFFKLSDATLTRGHHFKIVKPLVKSNLSLNSFASRVVVYWNFLPSDIFNVNNVEGFSTKLNCINFSIFIKGRAFSVTIIACSALFASMNFVHMMMNLDFCK